MKIIKLAEPQDNLLYRSITNLSIPRRVIKDLIALVLICRSWRTTIERLKLRMLFESIELFTI